MKPGDRVCVVHGDHRGRVGTIISPTAQVEAVRALLRPSPSRDEIERKFSVPAGWHGVLLDCSHYLYSPSKYVVIDEGQLSPTTSAAELQWIPSIREEPL